MQSRRVSSIVVCAVAVSLFGCARATVRPPVDAGAEAGADAGMDAARDAAGPCSPVETACHGVCTNLAGDSHNCGRCDNACPAGVGCAGATCSCHSPMSVCGGACVDITTDAANCGGCGTACAATEQCASSRCVPMCTAPEVVCFARPSAPDGGVEDAGSATVPVCADLQTDTMNCGHCNTRCGGGGVCTAGHCMCPGGGMACAGMCTDVMTDLDHCGSCSASCGAGGTCAGGTCTACGPTRTSCTGVCADLMADIRNCGMCGHNCALAETCVAGVCSCGAPRIDCGTGCTDPATDGANCGMCGNSCGTGGACVGSACTCAAGFMMCGAGCSDVVTDRNNCGMCGNVCPGTQVCVASACSDVLLYQGLTSPIAGCSVTSYNTTAPTALGGTYPFNTGDSNACRAWKLAATVCTTPPTAYWDTTNENWTCPISGGFTSPVFGTYCLLSTPQYSCSTCPAACNAMCIHTPLSLRNCMGIETTQL